MADNPLQVLPAHRGSNPHSAIIGPHKTKNLISPPGAISGFALMNPLMILVKIIKLRWIHILSYDQMVSR
ncbi:hypothetical protein, partial [Klebsiella pneumoniae]